MRLFAGLFPPEDAREDLRRHLHDTAHGRRLTPIDRWHLTLAFLGEVPAESLPSVEQAVGAAAVGGPIRLRLVGGGSFGSAVWAGVDGDRPALTRLRDGLVRSLEITDDRPFTPHLTVAYQGGRELRAALDGYAGPSWAATELVLVHSRHPTGEGYDQLRAWSL